MPFFNRLTLLKVLFASAAAFLLVYAFLARQLFREGHLTQTKPSEDHAASEGSDLLRPDERMLEARTRKPQRNSADPLLLNSNSALSAASGALSVISGSPSLISNATSIVKNGLGHKLCVVVPFRDRFDELQIFVPHLSRFLRNQSISAFELLVMNQADGLRFNRAALINVGFFEAKLARCDYFVMHDVDLLPLNAELNYGYPATGAYHVASPEYHPRYNYSTFIGGILSVAMQLYEDVNGMSNRYWGWGLEDDEFYLRLKEAGIRIERPKNLTTNRHTTFAHIHDNRKHKRDMAKLFNQQQVLKKRDRQTGLATIDYEIRSRVNMTLRLSSMISNRPPTARVVLKNGASADSATVFSLLNIHDRIASEIGKKVREIEQSCVARNSALPTSSKAFLSGFVELESDYAKFREKLRDQFATSAVVFDLRKFSKYTATVQDIRCANPAQAKFQFETHPTYEELWRAALETNKDLTAQLDSCRGGEHVLRRESEAEYNANGREMSTAGIAAQVLKKDQEIAQLQRQIASLNRQSQSLQTELNETRQKLQANKQQFSDSTSGISLSVKQLESKIVDLQDDLLRLNEENKQLRARTESSDKIERRREIELVNERDDLRRRVNELALREKQLLDKIDRLAQHSLSVNSLPTAVCQPGIPAHPPNSAQTLNLPTFLPRSQSETTLNGGNKLNSPSKKTSFKRDSSSEGTQRCRTYNRYCPICRIVYGSRQDETGVPDNVASNSNRHSNQPICAHEDRLLPDAAKTAENHADHFGAETTCGCGGISGLRLAQLKKDNEAQRTKIYQLEDALEKMHQERQGLRTETQALSAALDESRKSRLHKGDTLRVRAVDVDLPKSVKHISNEMWENVRESVRKQTQEVEYLRRKVQDMQKRALEDSRNLQSVVEKSELEKQKLRSDYEQALKTASTLQSAYKILLAKDQQHQADIERLQQNFTGTSEGAVQSQSLEFANNLQLHQRLRQQAEAMSDLIRKLENSEKDKFLLESKLEEANRSWRSLKDDFDRLQRSYDELRERAVWQETLLDERQRQLPNCEASVAAKEREIEHLEKILSERDTDFRQIRQSVTQMEHQLVDLEAQLGRAKRELKTTEDSRDCFAKDNQSLGVELLELQRQIGIVERNLAEIEDEKLRMQNSLTRYVSDIEKYKQLIESKDRERDLLLEQYQAAINHRSNQATHRISTENEFSDLKVQLETYKLQLTSTKRDADLANVEKERALDEQRSLRQQLKRVEASLAQLRQSVDECQAAKDSLYKDLCAARQLCLGNENDRQQLQRDYIKQEAELEKLKSSNADLRSEVDILRIQVSSEQSSVKHLESRLLSEEREIWLAAEKHLADIRALKSSLADYEAKVGIQEREIEALQDRLRQNHFQLRRLNGELQG